MKITKLEVREISADTPRFSGGTYSILSRRALLCRLTTDEGFTATVCAGNEQHYDDLVRNLLRGIYRDIVVGSDPLNTTEIWSRMFALATGSRRSSAMRALSLVDLALWDLKGQISGLPVWKLIGGARRQVPMIGIGGYYETSGDEASIHREMASLKALGLAGVKFKVGARSIEEDALRFRFAREAAGPDFILVADSNTAWSPRDAISFAQAILPYHPEWLEEPVKWQNMERGLREVRFKTGIRTAAGQSEESAFDCFSMLANESVDVINISATRGGGITGWLKLAGAAALANVRMGQVAEPHVSMHLMGGIDNGTFAEIYAEPTRDPFWHQLYLDRPCPAGGFITLTDRPGFGLTIDEEAMERFATEAWS